jgi:hypothetical protein
MRDGSVGRHADEHNGRESPPLCVVALIGFARLPRSLRGVVTACDWTLVHFADIDTALPTLRRTLRVDSIVVESTALDRSTPPNVDALLSFADGAPWDDRPVPVVIVRRGRRRECLPAVCTAHDVRVLAGPGTHYKELGRAVREACHLPGRCCAT